LLAPFLYRDRVTHFYATKSAFVRETWRRQGARRSISSCCGYFRSPSIASEYDPVRTGVAVA